MRGPEHSSPGAGARLAGRLDWCLLPVALVLLNLALTFRNVWPTPAIRLTADLSVELALAAAGIVAVRRWKGRVPAVALRAGAIAWVLLVAGRYVDVTTRSLYGRDVNLYWDLRHVPSVGAMFATVADPWQVAGVAGLVIVVPVAVYAAARWALACIARSAARPVGQRLVGGGAALVVLLFAAEQLGRRPLDRLRFADPVAAAYAREAGELLYEASGAGLAALGPAPAIDSDLAHVAGADVFVIFLESYGAVAWESEALTAPLAGSRAELAADIRDTGRAVVSALVESTTFGGESWLAHISLLSGTEVRDDRTNVRLMAQDRDTLVKLFGRRGYRTVAIVPGLLIDWPEGAFYGYDEIYDHERLGYRGPPFGWWSINDQYALARVDALEVDRRDRAPLFVFFSTLSTHAPFTPAPPYQPDWARVVSDHPYDRADLDRAWADQPDWTNLGPSYVEALRYAYATVGGYLRLRADRDLVMILVGDHQPPALVSGEGASWNVPVHVVASRGALLDRLRARRFRDGLPPGRDAVARMDTLLPVLLGAFGSR